MSGSSVLSHLVRTLDSLGINYFITGSVASFVYGEPRYTRDIDVVILVPIGRVDDLADAFPMPDYLCDRESLRQLVESTGMVNMLHIPTGEKIDLISREDSDFNESRFAHVRQYEVEEGVVAKFSAPEHLIVKKMDFYRIGRSPKHLQDIAGMLNQQGAKLNQSLIDVWARRLGVTDIWQSILDQQARDSNG